MKTPICPYLGLRDDPSTSLDFPSEGNYCHRAPSKPAVDRDYQRDVCLSEAHINCPLIIGSGEGPLPTGLTIPHNRFLWGGTDQLSRLLRLAIPLLLLSIGLFLGALWTGRLNFLDLEKWFKISWGLTPDRRNNPEKLSTKSPYRENEDSTALSSKTPRGNSFSAFDEMITPGAADPSLFPCKPPSGWVIYTVKPTDSLYRLSLVYNITIADLQMVNCMGHNTVIRPGDHIYVPSPPTATPTYVATATYTPRPYVAPPPTAHNPRQQPARPTPTPVSPPATLKPTRTQAPQPTATQPHPPTFTPYPTKPPAATPTSAPPL